MAINQPFTDLQIKKAVSGFYQGYSVPIALISKFTMAMLVIWALFWPANANGVLSSLNSRLLANFNIFYIVIVGLFIFFLLVLAILPQTGGRLMGRAGEKPEFSNFSWFSMMFGAGLGVGLMVFATAEPLGLWGSNPVTIAGTVVANSEAALESGYRYTFLHYGFHAWGIYMVTGLSLAYYAYTRDMPLTIRSALTPLLGKHVNGFAGHLVDVLGVVATILGVSVTIGFGVSQFINGIYEITGIEWIMDLGGDAPKPGTVGLVLSIILLLVFVIFGSFIFSMTTHATALLDYILHFIQLSFGAYTPQSAAEFNAALPAAAQPFATDLYAAATNAGGSFEDFKKALTGGAVALSDDVLTAAYAAGNPGRQFGWQSGQTTFYWAWWIAFSPFVGLFLARISKGRTVREFIVGCIIAPALVCFAWMTILGGTAIDLELTGAADGSIIEASNTAKLFATLGVMISSKIFLTLITIMCVLLNMTFLVTSADSGILVMNTIMSGGETSAGIKHRIVWGVILTLVIGTLLVAGRTQGGADPMEALKSAMIIGALPFTVVMGLMCVSLGKALFRDTLREKASGPEPASAGD
ncbi:BCCT family transporter [Alphaproteobacteria bacterium]|nr:BCCT family transporter [Alphaproteobacteria bacterium]